MMERVCILSLVASSLISLFMPSRFSFSRFCFVFSIMCCCDRMKTIKYEFCAIDLDWFVKSCYPLNSFVH